MIIWYNLLLFLFLSDCVAWSEGGKVLDPAIIVEKWEAFHAISFTICKTCKMFSFGVKAADGYFYNFRPFHLHLQMVHIPDLSLVEQLVHLQNGPLQRVSLGHVESASLASLLLEALKMGARSLSFLMAILVCFVFFILFNFSFWSCWFIYFS